MHWRKWDDLCKPKEIRGLNFRELVSFNQEMLAKQVWRVLEHPNCTISKVLGGRYFPPTSVLEATYSSSSSYFWKGFVWGLDLLKGGIRKNLGNRQSIKIFSDPWIPHPTTIKVLSRHLSSNDSTVVADFITLSLQWDVPKLNIFLNKEDVEVIIRLPISSSSPDTWIWHYDRRGKYSVKSGYKLSRLNSQTTFVSSSELET